MESYKADFLNMVIPSARGENETIGEYLEAMQKNKIRTEYKQRNLNEKIDKEDISAFCDYIMRYKRVKVSDSLKDYIVHIVNERLDTNDLLDVILKQNIIRNIPYEGYDEFKNVSYEDYDFVYKYLRDKYKAFEYSMPDYMRDDEKNIDHDYEEKNTIEKAKDFFMATSAGLGLAMGIVTLGSLIMGKVKKR